MATGGKHPHLITCATWFFSPCKRTLGYCLEELAVWLRKNWLYIAVDQSICSQASKSSHKSGNFLNNCVFDTPFQIE